jgi:hypothetical protein
MGLPSSVSTAIYRTLESQKFSIPIEGAEPPQPDIAGYRNGNLGKNIKRVRSEFI